MYQDKFRTNIVDALRETYKDEILSRLNKMSERRFSAKYHAGSDYIKFQTGSTLDSNLSEYYVHCSVRNDGKQQLKLEDKKFIEQRESGGFRYGEVVEELLKRVVKDETYRAERKRENEIEAANAAALGDLKRDFEMIDRSYGRGVKVAPSNQALGQYTFKYDIYENVGLERVSELLHGLKALGFDVEKKQV